MNVHADSDEESTSSADTNEAFLDMVGLPALDGISAIADERDEDENDIHIHPQNFEMHPHLSSDASASFLDVPRGCSRYLHHPSDCCAFVLNNFLDASECQLLIRIATKLSSSGFHYVTEAAHVDDDGVAHMVKLQEANKHKLSVFEHAPTLDKLWKKLKDLIPPHIKSFVGDANCGHPLGLNPRLRVLRYDASDNDVFEPHFDATTRVGNTTSLLTVLIYLNDGGGEEFDGGETYYLDANSPEGVDTATKVTPATGKVVIFEHDLFHSSVPLKFGTKYVLRTDILFDLNKQKNGGVDKPRGCNNRSGLENSTACTTLLDVCQKLLLADEEKTALDGMGLLDLTLDALFAPGVPAVKQMLHDALFDKEAAELLMKAALNCR